MHLLPLLDAVPAEIDYGRTIFIFVLCGIVVWLLAFPIGRMLEEYTKERAVRIIWVVVMLSVGAFFFLSMSGVGEVLMYAAKQHAAKKAAAE